MSVKGKVGQEKQFQIQINLVTHKFTWVLIAHKHFQSSPEFPFPRFLATDKKCSTAENVLYLKCNAKKTGRKGEPNESAPTPGTLNDSNST